jgi:FtsZ-interacting cell division protein ZipA
MDTWLWILLAAVVVALVVVGVAASRRRRSTRLREGFGPEYERVVDEKGDRRQAERELEERRRRRDEFEIRPLPEATRKRFAGEWQQVQERFVDDPVGAVRSGDDLVTRVMGERGYPMDDFEQRAADVSVDHPDVVENYREGHRLVEEHRSGRGSTEDLRQAMVHYRALFEQLLEDGNRGRDEEAS